jgi:hypothetical protein
MPCVSSCFFVYSDDGGEEEVGGFVMYRESERKTFGKKFWEEYQWWV